MSKICERAYNSTLCNNWDIYNMIKSKADKEDVPMWLLLGIMSKESGFGTLWHHSNVENCKANTYNRHGSKADRRADRAYRNQYIGPGCRLYKYESLDHGIQSLVYTIGRGYKACINRTPQQTTTCIAYRYVGEPDVAEVGWIGHVLSYNTQ